MADNLLFEQSNESQMTTEPFVSRQVVYVVDQNNGAYNGQIQLDTSSLSNSGKYASYSEGYFEVPLVLTLTQVTADANFASANYAFAAGLKAGYWHLLHSFSVEYNNTSVVQLTPFSNMYIHYKMMTSMSNEDVEKFGTGLGFWKDSATSFIFNANADGTIVDGAGTFNQFGQGVANNRDYGVLNLTSNAGTIGDGALTVRLAANGNLIGNARATPVNNAVANDAIETGGAAVEPIQTATANIQIGIRAVGGNIDVVNVGAVAVAFGNPTLGAGFTLDKSNLGFYKRQQSIAYSAVAGVTQGLLTNANAGVVGKNYYSQTTADANTVAWYILAKIRLKDMCDFFDKLPLVKGAYLRFIINVNTSQHTIGYNRTTAGGTLGAGTSLSSIQNIVQSNGASPIMFASSEAGQGSSGLLTFASTAIGGGGGQRTYTAALNIAKASVNNTTIQHPTLQQCRLYVPLYQMNPTMEEQYLSLNRTKKIVYRDIYQYQTDVDGGRNFNVLLTNGIPNPKFIVTIPMIRQATSTDLATATGNFSGVIRNGDNIPTAGTPCPVFQSPFASEPATTSPLIALNNFNIQIAGQNMFIQNQLYDFEQFTNELQSVNAINGGLVTGLTSGLISETDFQYMYRYYICDVSRRLPAEDRVPKSVQILGTNLSTQPITLYTFIEFEKEIEVDLITGQKLS
jgi:hypothetical protein